MKTQDTMAIDLYGNTFHNLGKYPRKALLERLGYKSAQKMYVTNKDGETIHTGYVIGGNWITLYKIEAFERKAEV